MSGEPNPFSTGGGGTAFEWLVATSYVISLLSGHTARGLPGTGTVVEISLQQRGRGYPVDDIVVIAATGTTESRLGLQAKHSLTFTINNLFCETILDCWNQFNSATFDRKRDSVGIAIAESCNIRKVRTHFQEILEWARTHSQSGFYDRVSQFKAKQDALKVFEGALTKGLGKKPSQTKLWQFLARFLILSFDLESPGSRDLADAQNKLKILCGSDARRSKTLFAGIFELVSRFSKAGGEINPDTLQHELGEILPMTVYANVRPVRTRLVNQVMNQLKREKSSGKYIPDIFTEIHSVKEAARLYSHSVLFLPRIAKEFQQIDFSFLNVQRQRKWESKWDFVSGEFGTLRFDH